MCEEVANAIRRLEGTDQDHNNGILLYRKLVMQGTIKSKIELKALLEKFHLHGLVDIYLIGDDKRKISDIYDEMENKFEALFNKTNRDDIFSIRNTLKNHIDSMNWRAILRSLINEGVVKIDADAEQSVHALFVQCNLVHHLDTAATVEEETSLIQNLKKI